MNELVLGHRELIGVSGTRGEKNRAVNGGCFFCEKIWYPGIGKEGGGKGMSAQGVLRGLLSARRGPKKKGARAITPVTLVPLPVS